MSKDTDVEAALTGIKIILARTLRVKRIGRHLSQVQLAEIIHSSQSRVARMEAADPSVSLDLLVRSLLAIGVPAPELARMIGQIKDRARL